MTDTTPSPGASSPTPKAKGKKQGAGAPAKGKRARGAGRPPLEGAERQGKASPQIAFRVVPAVRKRAKEVADQEGLTVSQLSRKALKDYLAKR